MEYKKIMNWLDNTKNQPSNFKTKEWVRISDDSHGTFYTNSQIKFETSMPKSELQDYSDAYIHVKVTITVPNTGTAALDNKSKHKTSKNYALFTDCISKINISQVDNAKEIDAVRI